MKESKKSALRKNSNNAESWRCLCSFSELFIARLPRCKAPQLSRARPNHSPSRSETKKRDGKRLSREQRAAEKVKRSTRQLSSFQQGNFLGEAEFGMCRAEEFERQLHLSTRVERKTSCSAVFLFLSTFSLSLSLFSSSALAPRLCASRERPPLRLPSDDGEPVFRERERQREMKSEKEKERERREHRSMEDKGKTTCALPTAASPGTRPAAALSFSPLSSLPPAPLERGRRESFRHPLGPWEDQRNAPLAPPLSLKKKKKQNSLSPSPPLLSLGNKQKKRKLRTTPPPRPPPRQQRQQQKQRPSSTSASTWPARAARPRSSACSRRRLGSRPSRSTWRRSGCASASAPRR